MIPIRQAWMMILISVLVVSGSTWGVFAFFNHVHTRRLNDEKFFIVALAQTCLEGEALKTEHLAELLGLSVDHPRSLLSFKTHQAEQLLLSNPPIKSARVSKVAPGTVAVAYQLRQPVAFLGDFTNTVLDVEGFLFPFHPFFTPKRLPEIILGPTDTPKELWGHRLKGKRADMALEIYHLIDDLFSSEGVQLMRIDLSQAFSLSYGQRQLVVILEEPIRETLKYQPRLLRLSSANYIQELNRYALLRNFLQENGKDRQSLTIDLRVPHLGFF